MNTKTLRRSSWFQHATAFQADLPALWVLALVSCGSIKLPNPAGVGALPMASALTVPTDSSVGSTRATPDAARSADTSLRMQPAVASVAPVADTTDDKGVWKNSAGVDDTPGFDKDDPETVFQASKGEFQGTGKLLDYSYQHANITFETALKELDWSWPNDALATLGFLEHWCRRPDMLDDDQVRPTDLYRAWLCASERFDPAKAEAELATVANLPPDVARRMRARITWAPTHLARWQAVIGAYDPAMKKILAMMSAARNQWNTPNPTRDKAMALSLFYSRKSTEDSRAKMARCGADVQPAWQAAVSALRLTKSERTEVTPLYERLAREPATSALMETMGRCFRSMYHVLPERAGAIIGPRTHAISRLQQSIGQIELDNAEYAFADVVKRGETSELTDAVLRNERIANIKVDGLLATITFVPRKEMITSCVKWRKTSRISKVHSDGRIEYAEDCTKSIRHEAPVLIDDVIMPKEMASTLQAGWTLLNRSGTGFAARNSGSKEFVWVLGARL